MQGHDPIGQVFALSSSGDATQLSLTAAEGYLLSRIDGLTSWRLLREIGGIPPEEVDRCLSRWLEDGLIEVVGGAEQRASASGRDAASSDEAAGEREPPVDAAKAPSQPRPLPQIDETALDPDLDLDLDVQRRILEFEAGLLIPYHELLGVAKGAEPKAVKRAYFKLSKEFHPDRYFRRQIGCYGERLERIFKKVLEAHEMLSDPDLCQVENQPEESSHVDAAEVPDATEREVSAPPPASDGARRTKEAPSKPRSLTKRERLRQRMPFKINHAAIAERRARADEIFRAAGVSQRAGRLQEAEASIRIAISFDPARGEFKEALGALRIEAAGARASKLLASPSDRMSDGELREALQLLEDVLIYRPHDPELNERAARVCLRLGRLGEAQEYVQTLIERTPEVAGHYTLLGRIRREGGDLDAAIAAFETALKYDEEDLDARRALASACIGAHDAAHGGKA